MPAFWDNCMWLNLKYKRWRWLWLPYSLDKITSLPSCFLHWPNSSYRLFYCLHVQKYQINISLCSIFWSFLLYCFFSVHVVFHLYLLKHLVNDSCLYINMDFFINEQLLRNLNNWKKTSMEQRSLHYYLRTASPSLVDDLNA